jgi:hypothetical protein
MQSDERDQILRELAGGLTRRGLDAPCKLALDMIAPLGMLASQAALFVRPHIPNSRWRSYAGALDNEEGWLTLQRLLERES